MERADSADYLNVTVPRHRREEDKALKAEPFPDRERKRRRMDKGANK